MAKRWVAWEGVGCKMAARMHAVKSPEYIQVHEGPDVLWACVVCDVLYE